MKITIVTVCYNAEATIEKTIQSILGQTYKNIEYLIKDGESTDATLKIVEKYLGDGRVHLIKQADTGIYSAMNQALDYVTGTYILYMNSGDYFYDCHVLEDIAPFLDCQLVYGNVMRIYQNTTVEERYHGKHHLMKMLLMGRMMSHQSLFTEKKTMKKFRFDESYKICADFDFVVRAKRNQCSIRYVDRTISYVDNILGVSSLEENIDRMRKEDDYSLKKSYPLLFWIIIPFKKMYRKIVDRK